MAEEINDLFDRLTKLSEHAAVCAERERRLEEKVQNLEAEMASVKEVMARGRGVAIFILSLGSIIGLLIVIGDKISRLFGHG